MGLQHVEVSTRSAGGESDKPPYDGSYTTRNICIAGLVASWAIGTALLVGGVVVFKARACWQDWPPLKLDRRLKEILPLSFNLVVTGLTECLGLIHATSLRWALKEQLIFNANLRLFTAPQNSWSLGRLANFSNAVFLVLTYVSTSLVLAAPPPLALCPQIHEEPSYYCNYDDEFVYVSPVAVIMVGAGFIGQAFIATCQLWGARIMSWSSGPINTAWILQDTGVLIRRHDRCMLGLLESGAEPLPSKPLSRQGSAWHAHKEVRRVVAYTWILAFFVYLWFAALYIGMTLKYKEATRVDGVCHDCDAYPGPDWSLLPDSQGFTSLVDITNLGDVEPHGPGAEFWGMYILLFVFQAFITMGLHCAELIVNMSRDEEVWRTMGSPQGYKGGRNTIIAALKSWKTGILFALKPVVHWVFGLGMAYYYGWGVFMRPPQILYLAFALTILAVFSTAISRQRPRGPQPATYGHLQTLVDLIDDWHEDMFWGQKDGEVNGTFHAGTSCSQLPSVSMDHRYCGKFS